MSSVAAVLLGCLLLLGAALARPQSSRPQWQVRSTYSGTPGFYRGGAGTVTANRSGFNRFGGNTRLTSLGSFSGGSTRGTDTSSGGSSFGSQFFRDRFKAIESSFNRSASSEDSD
ncbi:uncharacterized protein LOC119096012 [Pollicipes pollicipes]|uniref:uncharacterized protein LOC119095311 n=1 Tax=Pollicipes pollicipes TaxID=41117 RepID=UPI00188509E8|nr:uncharacterized protein LOC119095311 [Pollicipes pollicipes]XP_037074775.1 uncharacterized protein LOC119096012 [Pollicipes pollicipes]